MNMKSGVGLFELLHGRGNIMSSIFYIIGVVVVVLIILSFFGLR
jgi:hypothetical protein